MKVVVNTHNDKVVGIHLVGAEVAEILQVYIFTYAAFCVQRFCRCCCLEHRAYMLLPMLPFVCWDSASVLATSTLHVPLPTA